MRRGGAVEHSLRDLTSAFSHSLGGRTLAAPPVEGDEFKVGQRDVLVRVARFSTRARDLRVDARSTTQLEGQISLADIHAKVKGTSDAAATPARAVPGFFTRPGMLPSSAGPVASTSTAHTPRPASVSRPAAAAPSSSIDTPGSAGKVWNEQKPKFQRPFKPLVPTSAAKRSPSADAGARAGAATPVPSRLREKVEQERTKSIEDDDEEEVKPVAAAWKGKARAKVVDSQDATDGDENSPPKVDQSVSSPAKKRRRVDSVTTVQSDAPTRPSRRSAADAAFEMALSRQSSSAKRPPDRTVSLPARLSTSATIPWKPLIRKDVAVAKDTPMDDVFLDHPFENDDLAGDLMEGIGDESWGDDLAEEDDKPVVPVAGPSKLPIVAYKPKQPIQMPKSSSESSGTRYFSVRLAQGYAVSTVLLTLASASAVSVVRSCARLVIPSLLTIDRPAQAQALDEEEPRV